MLPFSSILSLLLFISCLFPSDAVLEYKVVAQRLSDTPIISKQLGADFDFNYNAALFPSGDGDKNTLNLLVRVQNLKDPTVPFAVGPSQLAMAQLKQTNGQWSASMPSAAHVWTPTGNAESCGTEDPRVAVLGHECLLTYTAYDCKQAMLSMAHTNTPGNVSAWVRDGFVFPARNWSKSGAALLGSSENGLTQHWLFWGDSGQPVGGIGIATAPLGGEKGPWNDTGDYLFKVRQNAFDSELVESGPAPLRLRTGDFLFVYNSARKGYPSAKPQWELQYNLGFAILDAHLPSTVIQRSSEPIMSPVLPWEIGNSTAFLTPNVVFLEGLVPDPRGCLDANVSAALGPEFVANAECFLGVYGAADSELGLVRIIVSQNFTTPAPTQPPSTPTSTFPPSGAETFTLQFLSIVFAVLFLT